MLEVLFFFLGGSSYKICFFYLSLTEHGNGGLTFFCGETYIFFTPILVRIHQMVPKWLTALSCGIFVFKQPMKTAEDTLGDCELRGSLISFRHFIVCICMILFWHFIVCTCMILFWHFIVCTCMILFWHFIVCTCMILFWHFIVCTSTLCLKRYPNGLSSTLWAFFPYDLLYPFLKYCPGVSNILWAQWVLA